MTLYPPTQGVESNLPTAMPFKYWMRHSEIKFFYYTSSPRYVYLLYRDGGVRNWRWEIWRRPVKVVRMPKYPDYTDKVRQLLSSSDYGPQHRRLHIHFHTALKEINFWMEEYESDPNMRRPFGSATLHPRQLFND